MKVYLVRHGAAMSSREDPARPLSTQGRLEAEKLAKYVADSGITVSETWHSTKARAFETAQILSEQGGLGEPLIERPGLQPEDPVEAIAHELNAMATDVCVVGHLPFMAYLAAALVSGQAHGLPIAFETCSMACLERISPGAWMLCWFVSPHSLP